jgi:hypothetical protein
MRFYHSCTPTPLLPTTEQVVHNPSVIINHARSAMQRRALEHIAARSQATIIPLPLNITTPFVRRPVEAPR